MAIIPTIEVTPGSTYYFAELPADGIMRLIPVTFIDSSTIITRASEWFEGHGVPLDTIGLDGDFYLNVDNGDVWEKVSGTWGAGAIDLTSPYQRVPIEMGQTLSVNITSDAIADYSTWLQGSNYTGCQFIFTLTETTSISAILTGTPDTDTLANLLKGYDIDMVNHTFDTDNFLQRNDDSDPPGNRGSRILATLDAGTYIIEGRWWPTDRTGILTLTLSTS